MKRLVNAYGMHQATHFLEGRRVSPEALARWTIIELRWRLLADYLSQQPESIKNLADKDTPDGAALPKQLRKLFRCEEVAAVAVGNPELGPHLDEKVIVRFIGAELDDHPSPSEKTASVAAGTRRA